MSGNTLRLRCYTKPEDDYILGVCLDLDVAVRGNSVEQVKEEMTKAIKGYFLSLDQKNFKDLFPRPVPFHVWLDYWSVCFLVHCLKFKQFFKKDFQIFHEQLIPKEFSINPCV